MAYKRTNGRQCTFESLENRRMMAGNVIARVSGGTAIIKGDSVSNAITIAPGINPGDVVVTGVNAGGSATNVNGNPNAAVTLAGVIHGLKVNMGEGNNSITINNLTINGKTTLAAGTGVDNFQFTSSTFNSALKVSLGKGADVLGVTSTSVAGKAKIKGGSGHDNVTLTSSTIGALGMSLGKGNDALSISTTTMITKTVLNGGGGINPFTNGASNYFGSNNLLKKNLAG